MRDSGDSCHQLPSTQAGPIADGSRDPSGQHIVVRSSGTDPSVQDARLDGRRLNRSWVPASLVNRGGTLSFRVGPTPDTSWVTGERSRPVDR